MNGTVIARHFLIETGLFRFKIERLNRCRHRLQFWFKAISYFQGNCCGFIDLLMF